MSSDTRSSETHSGKIQYLRERDSVGKYIFDHSVRLTPEQEGIIKETAKHPRSGMLSSADEMQFLQNLVRTMRGKKTIDIGYSALSIALALPPDGQVLAIDVDEEIANVGKPFWKQAGVDHKIDLQIGPAVEILENILKEEENLESFDFVFVDADKENYDNYYEACLKLLRPGGIIAFDNMVWSGRVVDPTDQSSSTVALRHLAKKLYKDERVDVSMLTVGDGTYLTFKR